MCPIQSLLKLTYKCCGHFLTLQCQVKYIVFLLTLPFGVTSPLDGQAVVYTGCLVVVIPAISINCFAALSASSFPLTPMCAGILNSMICFP